MEGEVWKDIEGYEGLYRISSFGNVFSIKYDRFIKGSVNSRGYRLFDLWKNDLRKKFKLSRLVALNFLPNIENKENVDHIDRNKSNDNVSNLRWVDRFENGANRSHSKRKSFGIYKGTIFCRNSRKWRAVLRHKNIIYRLGLFASEIDAALAYNKKAKELNGEFAALNEIKEDIILAQGYFDF